MINRLGILFRYEANFARWAERPGKRRWATGVMLGLLVFNLLFVLADVFNPFRFSVPYSTEIYSADGVLLRAFLSADEKWRMQSILPEVAEEYKTIILKKEDRYFYYHFGVNPFSITRALINNLLKKRRTSGASTITMQTVRLLEPRPRTYLNKFYETFRAIQLELRYSKDEILNLYLNLIPAGGNVEGVKAASYLYFGRPPGRLSLAQAATLAVLPNRPNSRRPGRYNYALLKARNDLLKQMNVGNFFPSDEINSALGEPLDCYRRSPPNEAPHLSVRVVQNNQFIQTQSSAILTTIHAEKQRKIQQIVYNYLQRIRHKDVGAAAVLVMENKTGEIVAYIGSPDFENKADAGENDGVKAVRSPGSTLKPYLFALAMDAGMLTPNFILLDAPVNYNGYLPENYDGTFYGPVTAEFALSNSLNIPAVKILNDYGVKLFLEKLRSAGVNAGVRTENPGLSAILGGCGVKLEELVGLYGVLARDGLYLPPAMLKQRPKATPTRLLSSEATYLTARVLTKLKRPDLPFGDYYAKETPKIAWKTGTSYGRRDAWSVGFNEEFTVGVWCGNFDGAAAAALSGSEIATPLLFEAFRALGSAAVVADSRRKPEGLNTRRVCTQTGLPVGEYCSDVSDDDFIPGVSPIQKCNRHLPVWVNGKETIAYCGLCLPESGYQQKIYDLPPPELAAYWDAEKVPYRRPPQHFSGCVNARVENETVRILSPRDGAAYYLEAGRKQKIALECATDARVTYVYWFVEGKFIAKAKPQERIFFSPDTGKYTIICRTPGGGRDQAHISASFW